MRVGFTEPDHVLLPKQGGSSGLRRRHQGTRAATQRGRAVVNRCNGRNGRPRPAGTAVPAIRQDQEDRDELHDVLFGAQVRIRPDEHQ